MKKELNLNQKVFELCETYPELIEILSNVGFTEITKKNALQTVGKLMTIPKAAKLRGIDMAEILAALEEAGFSIEEPVDRVTLLKSYLERLNHGENLENVRADFVQDFEDVDASEILQAEEEMILEGMPYQEVQKLCDVHSALFHGSTREEQGKGMVSGPKGGSKGGKEDYKPSQALQDRVKRNETETVPSAIMGLQVSK